MDTRSKYFAVFERFLPKETAQYCFELWNTLGFEFKITKSRKSKLGDFRYNPQTKKSTITVNHDLNPFAFLVTYLHEVAHFTTYQEFGRSVAPHGKEWKAHFKKVAQPVLNQGSLPVDVVDALKSYLDNPGATSCSDPKLTRVLHQYSENRDTTFLIDLPLGSNFQFNNKIYKSLEKKRTRLVCMEQRSGKKYLINGAAQVKKL